MNVTDLPTLNASLNTISMILLLTGYFKIKAGNQAAHKKLMLSALVSSALFLVIYLVYHFQVGSVPYPFHDWTRPVYFAILIPHIILAAVQVPFIIRLVWLALTERFDNHRRLARFVWPVWMFVSASGVVIYLMLYVRT